ncbi:uncharacterized protein EV420DRAFT_1476697 [Desarmillaria tabescens]|uniref:Uncharacterized protein n=1 Tax=Armillaria tabescens TaxID=1929756 RepID=A0AA39NC39_ARMTA|nr:uncharacterized protein EV420DRAFT_1476697 [Desarmillaria tabescens]KAK0462916.1 hypothetical protein EV420DRAFT_1476697 [Desarmillaria tabescens]
MTRDKTGKDHNGSDSWIYRPGPSNHFRSPFSTTFATGPSISSYPALLALPDSLFQLIRASSSMPHLPLPSGNLDGWETPLSLWLYSRSLASTSYPAQCLSGPTMTPIRTVEELQLVWFCALLLGRKCAALFNAALLLSETLPEDRHATLDAAFEMFQKRVGRPVPEGHFPHINTYICSRLHAELLHGKARLRNKYGVKFSWSRHKQRNTKKWYRNRTCCADASALTPLVDKIAAVDISLHSGSHLIGMTVDSMDIIPKALIQNVILQDAAAAEDFQGGQCRQLDRALHNAVASESSRQQWLSLAGNLPSETRSWVAVNERGEFLRIQAGAAGSCRSPGTTRVLRDFMTCKYNNDDRKEANITPATLLR